MRDDGRPTDVFSWVRPWVPYGEDPFVWHDPAEDIRAAAPAQDAPVARAPAPAPVESEQPRTVVTDGPLEDAWVELPPVEDKPKKTRSRSRRGRAEPVSETVEAAAPEVVELEVVEAAPEPEAEAKPAKPARARRSRAKAAPEAAPEAPAEVVAEVEAPPVAEPAPEPVVEIVAVEPAAPAEPDPAEITAPPPKPKKGWWRRG